jgi:hypothetical protein
MTACGCGASHYRREKRSWWMRSAWTRKLYRCLACNSMLLLPESEVLTRRARERAKLDRRRATVAFGRS